MPAPARRSRVNPAALIVGHVTKDGTSAFYGTAPTLGRVPPDANQTGAHAYRDALAAAWGAHASRVARQYPLSAYGGSAQAAFVQARSPAISPRAPPRSRPARPQLDSPRRLPRSSGQADADAYVICPSYAIARAAAATGRPVWSYEFAHFQPSRGPQPSGAAPPNGFGCDNGVELDVVAPAPLSRANRRWATHGAEVHYVFGTTRGADGLGPPNNLTLCAFDPAEAELARTIGAYWTAFAASADPNTDTPTRTSTPHWPRSAGGAKGATQLLVVPDEEGELGPVTGLRQPACEFWERLFAGGAVEEEEEEVYP